MYNPSLDKIGYNGPSRFQQLTRTVRQMTIPANLIGLGTAIIALICLLGLPKDQYWNIRIPLYLIVATWTIIRPRAALYLLPFAIPWGAEDIFSLGGGLSAADILVALLMVSWLLGFTLRPYASLQMKSIGPLDSEEFNTPHYLAVAMLFLLLTMLLSVTRALNITASLKEIIKWSEVAVVLFMGTQYIRTRKQIWTLVVCVILAATTQALKGYQQEFLNIGPASFVRNSSLRVYGDFGQPNPYAGYINIALMIVLALMILGANWRTRILAGGATILLGGAEYYTESKGGWLALAIATLFILLVGLPWMRTIFWASLIALLGAIEAFLAGKLPESLFIPILTKIGLIDISFTSPSTENYANSERMAHWFAGIHMFIDHPIFGVGMGNYETRYNSYGPGIFVLPLGHAHNYYINIAAEAGIFGFVAFVLFIIAIFFAGRLTYKTITIHYQRIKTQLAKPLVTVERSIEWREITRLNLFRRFSILVNDRALAIGLLAALLSVCVHNLVDNLYVHGMTSLFALLLVLLIRLGGVAQDI